MKASATVVALLLAAAGLAAQAAPLKGEVLEARDVESYTYLRLKTAQGEQWAAVPTAAVKKGAIVTIDNPATMSNFQSKSLNRTFDNIVFGQLAVSGPAAASPQVQAAPPHGQAAPAAAAAGPAIKVAKASGPDSRTVAEVVTGKAALKDKAVLVRGQVVKVNRGILGKTWLHLQDGSGSVAAGSNDILVTTKDAAAVGDIVSARGTVRTDVTVGPGYAYAVLIEDAALRK